MPLFRTRITQLQLTISPFTSEQMANIGQAVANAKLARIFQGRDSTDSYAKPLVERYAKRKIRYGRVPIRNWTWSGQMLGSFKVLAANQNSVQIGFIDPKADFKATVQRKYWEMLADSPSDLDALAEAVQRELQGGAPVKLTRGLALVA